MARERVAVTMDHLLVVGDLVRAAEGFRRTWKGEAGGEMASLPERAERLRALLPPGFVLTHGTARGDEHMKQIIAEADYAISGQVAVSGEVLRAAKKLKLLHKWGVGYDNIDIAGDNTGNVIVGSHANDDINGLGGDDTIDGGAGADIIYGFGASDVNGGASATIDATLLASGLARPVFAASPLLSLAASCTGCCCPPVECHEAASDCAPRLTSVPCCEQGSPVVPTVSKRAPEPPSVQVVIPLRPIAVPECSSPVTRDRAARVHARVSPLRLSVVLRT